jgi:hypothetical protein
MLKYERPVLVDMARGQEAEGDWMCVFFGSTNTSPNCEYCGGTVSCAVSGPSVPLVCYDGGSGV